MTVATSRALCAVQLVKCASWLDAQKHKEFSNRVKVVRMKLFNLLKAGSTEH